MDSLIDTAVAEEPRLTARYWATFGLITLQLVCEIFDFFIVGFIVSAVAPAWKLSFGQTTTRIIAKRPQAPSGARARAPAPIAQIRPPATRMVLRPTRSASHPRLTAPKMEPTPAASSMMVV